MQRGGAAMANLMSGGALTAPPKSVGSLPAGAHLNSNAIPDGSSFVYDASTAEREWVRFQPTLQFGTSNVVTYSIPANNQPGLFWDLGAAKLIFTYSAVVSGLAGNYEGVSPIGGAFGIFRDERLQLNGVDVSQQNLSLDAYADWAKACLLYPRLSAMASAALGTEHAFEVDERLTSGLATPPFVNGTATSCYTDNAIRRGSYYWASQTGNNDVQVNVPLMHPLFQQSQLFPASIDIRLEKTINDSTYRYMAGGLLATEVFTVTPRTCELWIPRVTLTNAGLGLYRRLLQEASLAGTLQYKCLRTSVQSFTIPTGVASANFNLLSSRRPSCMAFIFVPSANLRPSTIATTQHFLCSLSSEHLPLRSLQVDIAGDRFPQNDYSEVRRDNAGNWTSGGTFALDLDAYKQMALQYRKDDKHVQPLLSAGSLGCGRLQMVWVNTQKSQEGVIDHKAPAEVIGNQSIQVQLHAALVTNPYTCVAISFFSDFIKVQPATGRIEGW